MSENRIRVRVQPELTPVRLEDKMDLNAEIDVGVDSHLKGLGIAGAVAVVLGTLALLVACVLFAFNYPTNWNTSHAGIIKGVVLTGAAGTILLFWGASAFFYGRTVLGSGHLDQFTTRDVQVGAGEAA